MNTVSLNNASSDINLVMPTIKVYRRRWLIVSCLALLTLVNGGLWISYASITDLTALHYGITQWDVNWLNLVYPLTTIAFSLPVAWINDLIGIKSTFIAAGSLNSISAALRFTSNYFAATINKTSPTFQVGSNFINNNASGGTNSTAFILVMLGQTIGSIGQPLCLFSSTKVAAIWFPADQRTLANTLGSMANPLGILIYSLVSPILVKRADDMFRLDICLGLSALIGLLWSILFVCQSRPPHPPSESALTSEVPPGQFCQQLKMCLSSWPFIVLLVSFGMGLGMFTALSSLMMQILCSRGINDLLSGIYAGLLIFCGLIGAGIVGPYVDRTKYFVGVVKVCYCVASLGIISFSILQFIDIIAHYSNLYKAFIGITVCILGAFGFAMYATALELGVESTYPVGETVSTGLLITFGQLASVAIILLMQHFAIDNPSNTISHCSKDYKVPVIGLAGVGTVIALLTVFLLKTDYRRNRVENYFSPETSTLRSDSDPSV